MPIQPPEIARMLVKPQSAYAAMIDAISCATQNAPNSANDGRSIKKNECERVTKMSAWEMMATWR